MLVIVRLSAKLYSESTFDPCVLWIVGKANEVRPVSNNTKVIEVIYTESATTDEFRNEMPLAKDAIRQFD